jgi:hypothetical protein
MNTKTSLLPVLMLCTTLLIVACSMTGGRGVGGAVPGSEVIRTELRDTGAFNAIAIEYPGAEILVRQGDEESVEIEADDNLLPQLSTSVLAGTLTIKNLATDWKTTVNPSAPVKIAVTVKQLNEIVFSAPVGNLEGNDLQADTLKLVLSGGAQVRLNGIRVHVLDSELSGAGDIQINGTADEIKLILSGLGNFNAAGLESHQATIELSGMGDATVRVDEKLSATITGAGSINYFGNPQVVQHVNGAGSVKPAE